VVSGDTPAAADASSIDRARTYSLCLLFYWMMSSREIHIAWCTYSKSIGIFGLFYVCLLEYWK
jgi:hypothetical protein